jgi:hypothetical protein
LQKPQQTTLLLSHLVPFAEQQSPWHTPEQHWLPLSHWSSSGMQAPQLLTVDLVPNELAGGQSELHAWPGGQHRTIGPSPVLPTHWV